MAVEPSELNGPQEVAPEIRSARGRKFLRLFLMAAGGLAAPCLALAAFFLTSGDDGSAPAAKSGLVQGGQVTPTTGRAAPAAPVTTTSTTAPSSPVSPPARDPFQPLVAQPAAGAAPAR